MLPNSPESPRSNDEICVATFAVKIKRSETHLSRFSSAPISAPEPKKNPEQEVSH